MEEVMEMITWSQLGIHNKPVSVPSFSQNSGNSLHVNISFFVDTGWFVKC